MRYYIIAGERSGDLHGSNLIRSLRQYDPAAKVRGFGGDLMMNAGADVVVHYEKLAFMGFLEIVKSLNTISNYIKKCKEDILHFQPDVIVLIDYGGFNLRIAKFGKKNGIKVFYYIPPKVWAWYQRRAIELKANVDRIFVILPFEKEFFKKFDCEVDYVGNPVLDVVKAHEQDKKFLERNNLSDAAPIVALLPGSRKQELFRMIPVMSEVASRFPEYQFAVATVNNFTPDHYKLLSQLSNVRLINEDTYNLLTYADAAIVTSGTATLETALFKVPQVVIYKASSTTYAIVKMLIRVPFISLVNLIAGHEVVKELIQEKANRVDVGDELKLLLADGRYREKMLTEYDAIYKTLDTGSASDNAARLMFGYLTKAAPH